MMTTGDRPFAGERMSYAFADTPLGLAAVALGGRGVAAIAVGEDRAGLLRDLGRTLAGAVLEEDAATLRPALDAVAAMLATPGAGFPLALDLRGPALERAVWDLLRALPAGGTTTYGALARALPLPATAREVGAACAANRLALAVPCHRVVKADGSISGYRWGVQRKRRLLAMEAAGLDAAA